MSLLDLILIFMTGGLWIFVMIARNSQRKKRERKNIKKTRKAMQKIAKNTEGVK